MIPGTILYDKNHPYENGSTGKKFLIVLNEGKLGFYIVVKTTSNDISKGRQFGCQLNDRYPNFFLPLKTCWFNKDTWVELNRFREFTANKLLAKCFSKELMEVAQLNTSVTALLLKCAIESEDISESQAKDVWEGLKTLQGALNS